MSEVYPKEFLKCPLCGSTKRVVEEEVKLEKKLGKIPEDRIATSNTKIIPIIDPIAGNYLSAPVLTVYDDICAGCGFEYPHVITHQVLPRHQIEALIGLPSISRQ